MPHDARFGPPRGCRARGLWRVRHKHGAWKAAMPPATAPPGNCSMGQRNLQLHSAQGHAVAWQQAMALRYFAHKAAGYDNVAFSLALQQWTQPSPQNMQRENELENQILENQRILAAANFTTPWTKSWATHAHQHVQPCQSTCYLRSFKEPVLSDEEQADAASACEQAILAVGERSRAGRFLGPACWDSAWWRAGGLPSIGCGGTEAANAWQNQAEACLTCGLKREYCHRGLGCDECGWSGAAERRTAELLRLSLASELLQSGAPVFATARAAPGAAYDGPLKQFVAEAAESSTAVEEASTPTATKKLDEAPRTDGGTAHLATTRSRPRWSEADDDELTQYLASRVLDKLVLSADGCP